MSKPRGSWNFVGIKPCGCIVAAAVDLTVYPHLGGDTKENREFIAEHVAEYMKYGYRVERKWVGEGGVHLQQCTHEIEQLSLI